LTTILSTDTIGARKIENRDRMNWFFTRNIPT